MDVAILVMAFGLVGIGVGVVNAVIALAAYVLTSRREAAE
jgi:hypothetical protein